MNAPDFITFTGADDSMPATDYPAMHELVRRFPVEWGILFSPQRTGQPRYPSAPWVTAFTEFSVQKEFDLAAHICGAYSRELIETGTCRALTPLLAEGAFKRVQINTSSSDVHRALPRIQEWAQRLDLTVIIQTRDAERFPAPGLARWLYDASGGRGVLPERWPATDGHQVVGYAGGLGPDNVAAAVAAIGSSGPHQFRYWIDMESGVRDPAGYFSLARCEAVCSAVYGGELPL